MQTLRMLNYFKDAKDKAKNGNKNEPISPGVCGRSILEIAVSAEIVVRKSRHYFIQECVQPFLGRRGSKVKEEGNVSREYSQSLK